MTRLMSLLLAAAAAAAAAVVDLDSLFESVLASGVAGHGPLLGSKRPYAPLDLGELTTVSLKGPAAPPQPPSSEPPSSVLVLSRHGARLPTARKAERVLNLAWRVTGDASAAAQRWAVSTISGMQDPAYRPAALTARGEREMAAMADTLGLGPPQAHWDIRTTSVERTVASCEAFFGAANAGACRGVADDGLLRSEKMSEALRLDNIDKLAKAVELFSEDWVQQRIQRVRVALEVSDVSTSEMFAAYHACQLEVAAAPTAAAELEVPFACSALVGGADAAAHEAIEDAEAYAVRFAYPQRVAAKRRIVERIAAHLEGAGRAPADGPAVALYFAHDSTLQPLLRLLDYFHVDDSGAGLSGMMPFASRLTVEGYGPRGSDGVQVTFNGAIVATYASAEAFRARHLVEDVLGDEDAAEFVAVVVDTRTN